MSRHSPDTKQEVTRLRENGLKVTILQLAQWRGMLTDEEKEITAVLLDFMLWQIGEGHLPEGWEYDDCKMLLDSEKVASLAQRTEEWYRSLGYTEPAMIGPFLVCVK